MAVTLRHRWFRREDLLFSIRSSNAADPVLIRSRADDHRIMTGSRAGHPPMNDAGSCRGGGCGRQGRFVAGVRGRAPSPSPKPFGNPGCPMVQGSERQQSRRRVRSMAHPERAGASPSSSRSGLTGLGEWRPPGVEIETPGYFRPSLRDELSARLEPAVHLLCRCRRRRAGLVWAFWRLVGATNVNA